MPARSLARLVRRSFSGGGGVLFRIGANQCAARPNDATANFIRNALAPARPCARVGLRKAPQCVVLYSNLVKKYN